MATPTIFYYFSKSLGMLNTKGNNKHNINNNNNISVAIQRFNAVLLHGGFPSESEDHPD